MINIKHLSILFLILPTFLFGQKIEDYVKLLQTGGDNPIHFVQDKLKTYDLVMFDDGLHPAYEPFQFYIDLINSPNTNLDFIFLETLGVDSQPDIDAYLKNEKKDKKLLISAFQNDYSALGWRYETYLDLMSAVWDYNNSQTDEKKKIKVMNTSQPIYWEGLHTRQDYDIFLESLTARDYFMYKIIIDKMDNFRSGKKGIYLANTRHVYKNIKNSEDQLYWNTGTFFHNWHPGKTYSVRIHNVMLNIESVKKESKSVTAEGLDNVKYSWISPDNGTWDEAFKLNGNKPVALSLEKNAFGNTKYVGNYMLNSKEGQTMYDAYDALIFLAPLEQLHFSAKMDYFYTDNFKEELIRRIRIIHGEDLEEFLKNNNAKSINEYIEIVTEYKPKVKNPLVAN